MPATDPRRPLHRVTRRDFLKRAAVTGGLTALAVGASRMPVAGFVSYPDWIPASTKPPKRGGLLKRASAWDPPVIDPRLTQSIGLFQFAGLTSNRLLRHVFTDEATGYNDLTLKGDLAESWQGSADQRVLDLHVRGNRGHGDAGLSHPARGSADAQCAVRAERGRARGRDLLPRGPRGGRRPQEADGRHGALHLEGARVLRGTVGYGSPTIARLWIDK